MMRSSDTCVDPAALTDEELLRCALEEPPTSAVRHLDHCPACRSEVENIRQSAALLGRGACPPTVKIGEWTQGLLSAQEELIISAHVRSCANCSHEQMEFAALMADGAPQARPGLSSSLKRVLAQRVQRPALGALRGDGGESTLVYRTEDRAVLIDIEAEPLAPRNKLITGRVDPMETLTPGTATLFRDQAAIASGPLDDRGHFYLPGVRAGTYRLEIRLAETDIVISDFVVA